VLTGDQIYTLLSGLVPSSGSYDPQASFASTALLESDPPGNPNSIGDTTLASGPSYGLWQVLTGAHPSEAAAVKQIMDSYTFGPSGSSGGGAVGSWGPPAAPDPSTDLPNATSQAQVLQQMFAQAVSDASTAASTLVSKGITVSEELAAGLVDAAWNHGGANLQQWANSTVDGALATFHQRYQQFLDEYRKLRKAVSDTENTMSTIASSIFWAIAFWAGAKLLGGRR
jgi:hypothetical protein